MLTPHTHPYTVHGNVRWLWAFLDGQVRELKEKCNTWNEQTVWIICEQKWWANYDSNWLSIALWVAVWKKTTQMLYGKVRLKVLCDDENNSMYRTLKGSHSSSVICNIDNKQLLKNWIGTSNSKLLLSLMVKARKLSQLNPDPYTFNVNNYWWMFGVAVWKICRWYNQIKKV